MSEEIFKIRKDIERARSIFGIAKDRFELIEIYPKEKVYKIVEEYYESIKEMIVSMMYFEGCKTLSHIKMIEWIGDYEIFSEKEIKLIDKLRKLRNGTLYYGEEVSKDFLDNYCKEIEKVISKLIKFVEGKLNGKS